MNSEQIRWRTAPRRGIKPYQPKRIYDVLITTNKSGVHKDGNKKKDVVRVGLINRAGIAFNEYAYIAFSDISKETQRIYFKGCDEKEPGVFALSPNKNDQISMSFQFTPTGTEMSIIAEEWEDRTFPIRFDDECQLYYIDKTDGVHKAKKARRK